MNWDSLGNRVHVLPCSQSQVEWVPSYADLSLALLEVGEYLEEAKNCIFISLDAAEVRDSQQTKISP